jgi:hypothetical protein
MNLRIDADDSLGERLERVKTELYIGGKGHSETIRRLIDHYEQNRDLNKSWTSEWQRFKRPLKQASWKPSNEP